MAELFSSGRLVDLILIVVVLEAAALIFYWARARRGIEPFDLLPNLLAGAFLLLALRSTLVGSDWQTTCVWLAAAGLAHIVDVYRRWR